MKSDVGVGGFCPWLSAGAKSSYVIVNHSRPLGLVARAPVSELEDQDPLQFLSFCKFVQLISLI